MCLLLLLALVSALAGENGTLRIQSEPGAEVLWEGVSLERTDPKGLLTVSDIPPGRFEVVLRKPGFREFRASVTVAPGETIVLEARLARLSAGPSPIPATKPPPPRAEEPPGNLPETKATEQKDKLSRMLESEPKPGPLPVWPAAAPAAAEEKRFDVPAWPFILGIGLLALVLWLSRRIKRAAFTRSPALLADSDVPEPARSSERSAAFLNDLKKREELLEQGVEIIPAPAVRPVIDLDAASVREVEDQ